MFKWLKWHTARFVDTYHRWEQDEGSALAAAVAYYVGLAFFPLLIVGCNPHGSV